MDLQNELKALMYSINIDKIEPTFIENLYIAEDNFNTKFESIACDIFDIKVSDLSSKSRKREIVWCRYFIFEYLKKNSLLNFESIGEKYSKDHSSVSNGLKKHRELLADKIYKMYHNQFLKNINQ